MRSDMQWWAVAIVADVVVGLAYAGVAGTIARAVWRSGDWRRTALPIATAAIFATSALGHGARVVHVLLSPAKTATRADVAGGPLVAVDVVTAAVGVWYWTMRRRLPLVRLSTVRDEARQRRRDALDIHDSVVQGLVLAKLSLELGETEAGMAALESTLEAARGLVSDLVGAGEGDDLVFGPGDLRRLAAAGPR